VDSWWAERRSTWARRSAPKGETRRTRCACHADHGAGVDRDRGGHQRRAGRPAQRGPHGFAEILYAYTSQTNNNGSAFGGLSANTPFFNITGTIGLLLGRFAIIVPVLALAGSMAAKNVVPSGLGTFRTDQPMFAGLLTGVVVIVGALTFFPALALGPIVEQLSQGTFF
jgi:K+-transporting ATPase ATPase A chain